MFLKILPTASAAPVGGLAVVTPQPLLDDGVDRGIPQPPAVVAQRHVAVKVLVGARAVHVLVEEVTGSEKWSIPAKMIP